MSNWNNLTVSQYQELREVEKTSFDSMLDKTIEMISIIEEIDPVELEELSPSQLMRKRNSFKWLQSEPPKEIREIIEGFEFQEFDKFNLAEYIDITFLFGEDYIDNLPKICAILYKQNKVDEWGNKIVEPYEYDLEERSKLFYDVSIGFVYGIIPKFIAWKENFENNYAPLFKPDFEADEDYEPTPEDKKEDELEEEKKKFSWESFVYNLCDGDLTKSDKVLDLKLIYIFNMLSMKKTFE